MRLFLIAFLAFIAATTDAHACTNPTGIKGEVIMNGTHNIPAYCDGTNWIAMAGGNPNSLNCPNGLAACGGRSDQRLVFTTSGGQSVSSTSNAVCQAYASAAGLYGRYFAWFSTSATNQPATTFEKSIVPYVKVNGAKVADNWTDLTDGTLDSPIDRYETGASHTGFVIATDTFTNGTYDPSANYIIGSGYSATSNWTVGAAVGGPTGSRAYCFEQPRVRTRSCFIART